MQSDWTMRKLREDPERAAEAKKDEKANAAEDK